VGIFSGNESIKERKQRLHIAAPQNWGDKIYIYTRFVYAGKACELYKKKLVPGSEAERRKPCILAIFRTSLWGGRFISLTNENKRFFQYLKTDPLTFICTEMTSPSIVISLSTPISTSISLLDFLF
jgi:hypothetical protein